MYKLVNVGNSFDIQQRIFYVESIDDLNKIPDAIFPDIAIQLNLGLAWIMTSGGSWTPIA